MDGVMWQKDWDAKCDPEVWQSLNREGQGLLGEGFTLRALSGQMSVCHGVDTFTQHNTGQER